MRMSDFVKKVIRETTSRLAGSRHQVVPQPSFVGFSFNKMPLVFWGR